MLTATYWAAVAGFVLTISLIALLIPFAKHLSLVDHPDERKRHASPTPIVGGVAMYVGVLASFALAEIPIQVLGPLAVGSTILIIVGVMDDIRPLGYRVRLCAQCAAAAMLAIWGGMTIDNLGNIFGLGSIALGPLTIPFTLFAVVGLINAVNMLDGMDGLAGGVIIAMLVPVFAYAALTGITPVATASLLVIACVVGFLLFNYRFPWRDRAPAFMGDAGSNLLGFVLAWIMLALLQDPDAQLPPIAVLWVVAFPVADTCVIMWRRRRKGLSMFRPDRDHVHYLLQRAGFGVNATVLILSSITAVFAAAAIAASLNQTTQSLMVAGFVLLLYLHNWFLSSAWRLTKNFRHLLTTPDAEY